jgi:pimeloyl-ACP methyl ester carboxylesterase
MADRSKLIVPDPIDAQGAYFIGSTTLFASTVDQRFSYCLYVPRDYPGRDRQLPLVVLQHGTGRSSQEYRDNFVDFAERFQCIVLAPLFPAAIGDPDDLHNFKFIKYRDIRFDLVLLAIIDEVGERFDVVTDKFYLYGFSGGGQFVHRFFYLHPDRLAAVSIGAPGRITLIDPEKKWWLGWEGMADAIGAAPKPELLSGVPVQMIVGGDDVETWEINNRGDSNWMDGVEETGTTRIERITTLRKNFEEQGIAVRMDVVPGVAHEPMKVLEPVKDFFGSMLTTEKEAQ